MVSVREIDDLNPGYRLAQLIVACPHDVLDGSADKGSPMLHVNVLLRLDNATSSILWRSYTGNGGKSDTTAYLIPSMKPQFGRPLDKMPKRLIVCCDGNILLITLTIRYLAERRRPPVPVKRHIDCSSDMSIRWNRRYSSTGILSKRSRIIS